jgi:N-methylhydantoinase A
MIDLDQNGLSNLRETAKFLEEEATHWLRKEQGFDGESKLSWSADMRYRGQSYEIETAFEKNDLDALVVDGLAKLFHEAHHSIYEHSDPNAEVQIVNLRLVISGEVPKPKFLTHPEYKQLAKPLISHTIYLDGQEFNASLFERDKLEPGHHFTGPAIISQNDTTTVVLPDFDVKVDQFKNLIISKRKMRNGD